jgi:GntR family transcriptional regulator
LSEPLAGGHLTIRADHRPLYVQASEALHRLVASGAYLPGERLPSEIELSQKLGISRPTLREAMRLLEEEGTVIRRHGVGTFLASPRPVIEGGLEVLESIDRMAERRGLRTHMAESRVLERRATAAECQGLGVPVEQPPDVTVVTRVIVADSLRVAFLTDVVPQEYLRQSELSEGYHGSVLDHLLRRAEIPLSHSLTELDAEAADPELGRLLRMPRGAPLLRLEAQLFAQDGHVVDYSVSYFVPGFFRLHVIRRVG